MNKMRCITYSANHRLIALEMFDLCNQIQMPGGEVWYQMPIKLHTFPHLRPIFRPEAIQTKQPLGIQAIFLKDISIIDPIISS